MTKAIGEFSGSSEETAATFSMSDFSSASAKCLEDSTDTAALKLPVEIWDEIIASDKLKNAINVRTTNK